MGDGMTETARDQGRVVMIKKYLDALKAFLIEPTSDKRLKVVKLAKETDSIKGGYMQARTNLSSKVEKTLSKLEKGDKETWAKFLWKISESEYFEEFKRISPFVNKFLISVNYGCGFVRVEGEMEPLMSSIISDRKGWKTYDADKYIIAIDKPEVDNAEVFWMRCDYVGKNGPRKANE